MESLERQPEMLTGATYWESCQSRFCGKKSVEETPAEEPAVYHGAV